MKNNNPNSIFDIMTKECFSENCGTDLLDECMTFNVKLAEKIPLRYRLIAMGFVKKWSLDDVNKSLIENNCAKLYSRSIWESTLIYAFINGLDYNEWRELAETIKADSENVKDSSGFPDGAIRFIDLEKYVKTSSIMDGDVLRTQQLTRTLDNVIIDTVSKRKDFHTYIKENIESFSYTREKTRYYFCKYLYYMLKKCIDGVIAAEKMGLSIPDDRQEYNDEEIMVDEKNAFRCMSALSRKKMSLEEIEESLRNSPISCSVLYDGFNQFFYDYVEMDWMDILMEKYEGEILGDFNLLYKSENEKLKNELVEAAKYFKPEWAGIPNDEVLHKLVQYYQELEDERDRASTEEINGKKPPQNRLGENTIRKYIRGQLDIGRTTLICFILYYGYRAEHILPTDMVITRDRLSGILLECGYAALRDDNDFDSFVSRYIESGFSREYLTEKVTQYSEKYSNSDIYKSFKSEGRNSDNVIKHLLGK